MSPTETELLWIQEAKKFLDHPSLVISLANAAGKPLEMIQNKVPARIQKILRSSTEKALQKALDWALSSADQKVNLYKESFDIQNKNTTHHVYTHSALSAISGAVGGFFGPLSLAIELPISTTLILRAIVKNAQSFGFDPNHPDIKAECLFVFTLGSSQSSKDDEMNSAYFTSRLAFAQIMRETSAAVVGKSGTSLLTKLIARIATRFEVAVTEKFLAQGLPILGAIGGASINAAFADYFGRAAQYHFGLKALELKYGKEIINQLYLKS